MVRDWLMVAPRLGRGQLTAGTGVGGRVVRARTVVALGEVAVRVVVEAGVAFTVVEGLAVVDVALLARVVCSAVVAV